MPTAIASTLLEVFNVSAIVVFKEMDLNVMVTEMSHNDLTTS